MHHMLNRRIVALGALAATSCGQPTFDLWKPALSVLSVTFPERQQALVLQKIAQFAREHSFQSATRALRSRHGTRQQFELRRRDIWITGVSPLDDVPNDIATPPGQMPEAPMQIDNERFIVSFVRGSMEPSQTTLDDMIRDFTAALVSIEGVSVVQEPAI